MKKLLIKLGVAVLAVAALQACAATYDTRVKHLDEVAAKGVAYRTQLQKQGTQPSKESCTAGWGLLQDDPPSDIDGGGVTDEWGKQVKEAYVKSCLTGQPRPKPEPSGIDAVTPVPIVPVSAAPSTPVSATPSTP